MYLGGGTPIQKACGFEDSIDDMYRYMMAACGPDPDEAEDRPLLRREPGPLRLAGRPGGGPFDPSFCADTSMAPNGVEGLVYSGGEDAYPFNQIPPGRRPGYRRRSGRRDGY